MKAVVVVDSFVCPKCKQIGYITTDTIRPEERVRCVNCNTTHDLVIEIGVKKQESLSELKHKRAMDIINAKNIKPVEDNKKGIEKWLNKMNII